MTRPAATSLLARVEVASALQRKESFGELSRAEARRALARFDADCMAGRILLAPLRAETADAAAALIHRLRLRTNPAGLRSLDAIHLATAMEVRASAVVTTDVRLREACALAGLGVKP